MPAQLILEFHGIGSPHGGVTDEDEPLYRLSRETFASLLQAIVVTREGSDLPIAITFDDGNESDALIALPELAKRNLKAIFFIVGGRIGMPHYLDRAALRDLVSAGMETKSPFPGNGIFGGDKEARTALKGSGTPWQRQHLAKITPSIRG
jgi:hypothetical protein